MMGAELFKQPTCNESLKDRLLNMSDEEFLLWSKEKYGRREKESLPYKTIVFKQNERGFYSDDLHKIVLLDNHDVLPEIEIGVPYIVEVIRDTAPTEERKGAIIVKVIKLANAEEVIKTQECDQDLHQLEFCRLKKDSNEMVSRGFSKLTFVDKNSQISIDYKDEVVGRIIDKGNINVFKPLLKAKQWQRFIVELSALRKLPELCREVYNGIKRVKTEIVWSDEPNFEEIVNGLNETDRAAIKEVMRREHVKKQLETERENDFAELLERSANQAWREYVNNRIVAEEIDNGQHDFKVKVGESWQTINSSEIDDGKTLTGAGDWQRLVAIKALEIMKNNRVFIELLNKNENINYILEGFEELLPPEGELMRADSDVDTGEIISNYRKMTCKNIEVNLPYVKGEMIFEPVLVRYDDVHDSDWGRHGDDSTGNSYFKVVYKLQAEKLELTNELNDLPEHISTRVKHLIDDQINSLTELKVNHLFYVVAEWKADYKNKLDALKKLDLDARFELLKPENKEKQITRLLQERLLLADKEFSELQVLLPVDEYAQMDGKGGVEYFGLPVSRKQATKSKHFSRSSQSIEVPDVGQYKNVFAKYGKEQLSFWLDQHAEYFKRLIEKRRLVGEQRQLPKLEISIADEENRLRAEMGLQPESYHNHSHYTMVNDEYLNVSSRLSDDFSRLVVVVNNLNRGFRDEIKNAPDVYNFIKERGWAINSQVLRILIKSGIEKNKAEKLLSPNDRPLPTNIELPFKGV